ncbi:hypothetical protein AAFF_G00095250 [Aldrovandia affinis]|uniref:Uncharacterized protein n=1 Tax=Aldrovandia affinis TaxID=143900 RepID=A0AAD7WC52_9TELE|nr:hypothetical protein AAFF_G00095250 [Aldrovandia affinis]
MGATGRVPGICATSCSGRFSEKWLDSISLAGAYQPDGDQKRRAEGPPLRFVTVSAQGPDAELAGLNATVTPRGLPAHSALTAIVGDASVPAMVTTAPSEL